MLVVKLVSCLLPSQWVLSRNCSFFRDGAKNPHFSFLVVKCDNTKKFTHYYTVYHKTRIITFSPVSISGKKYIYIHCDCDYFICHTCPCCHFYTVVHRPPVASEFPPQCCLAWVFWYAEPEKKELKDKLTEMS